ncbi:hypothetical protein ACMAZF_18995 [Psychrobium sp. nBUS_13]|uniref:hypothetical protein n=1 Tax=Psychrobium sp. nBUS_13 TaxID=3395319 RepID=UPI003EC09938
MIKHQVDLVNVVVKECPIHNENVQVAPDEENPSTATESAFDFYEEKVEQEPVCICETVDNNISSSY